MSCLLEFGFTMGVEAKSIKNLFYKYMYVHLHLFTRESA